MAALLILWKFGQRVEKVAIYRIVAMALSLVMLAGMVFADNISESIEGGLYRDRVVLIEQTQYQKIVMTKHRDDV